MWQRTCFLLRGSHLSFCSISLTIRFHVAVCLFSDISQMTSKCVKKNNAQGTAECFTDFLTTFWCLLWSITVQTQWQHGILFFTWWKSRIFLIVMPFMSLSSKRLQVRTNQNACIIQLIIYTLINCWWWPITMYLVFISLHDNSQTLWNDMARNACIYHY